MNPDRPDPAAVPAADVAVGHPSSGGAADAPDASTAPSAGPDEAAAAQSPLDIGDEEGDRRSVWRHLCADGCNCRPI